MVLSYSPGAVSLAVHILLRELDRPFELHRVPTGDEAHRTPEYLAVNPVGRVPSLAVEGQVLTETPAILRYVARGTSWLPEGTWLTARCDEILSQAASMAHPAFRMAVRPDRFLGPGGGDAALSAVRAAGAQDFAVAMGHLDRALPDDGWALGTQPTVADLYLAVLWSWMGFLGASRGALPRLRRVGRGILARPAAQAAFRAEGLVDANGQPTPPERV